jgi:AraC family ethanolamine operon transcriptional activator
MTPDAFDIYGIVIREETLLRAAEREARVLDLQSLGHSPRLTVPQARLDQVRSLLEQVLYRDAQGLDSEHQQQLASQALLQLVTNAAQPAAAPSYAHRRKVVEQVKRYLAEHPDAPLSIPELCERVHVSRRTLQYSFESILGISPLQFLRSARLNQVRRALCEPQQNNPIASIAAERGFWHPGQFARDYKALFGENPSETIKRRR